jgi:predicted DNA-binding protein (MmcQ/YjbR family)
MNFEIVRNYCNMLPGVTECFPFDDVTLVFKVDNKMFLLLSLEPPFSMNVKCDPELAIQLREEHSYVLPGYHMNKAHWNTVMLEEATNRKLVEQWIIDSYDLVCASLPKKSPFYKLK